MSSEESSDEEYKPEKDEDSDIPSEAETDYDSDGNKKPKTTTVQKKSSKKRRKHQLPPTKVKSAKEKEIDEDEEKRRTDALWADFLGETNSTASSTSKENTVEPTSSATTDTPKTLIKKLSLITPKKDETEEENIQVKIFDFAGEEVKVVEKVTTPKAAVPKPHEKAGPMKRLGTFTPSPKSGISSVLNQLGKKDKISVLEKTKLDWKSYKTEEGIEEELQTFNKGKDGYLERQDFLERTDVRQFQIEKGLRQSKRSNR